MVASNGYSRLNPLESNTMVPSLLSIQGVNKGRSHESEYIPFQCRSVSGCGGRKLPSRLLHCDKSNKN